MEQFDVAIIGGGSAGLSALKELSDLNKSAILIEAGNRIGIKNVSGGILYSKHDPHGRIYNIEDVFGPDFATSAPIERLIKKYFLHSAFKNKIFTMDLTPLHEYKTNFGYSVLLNRLNPWLAERASESAEKQGGGIITGVHVSDIQWIDDKTIVRSDELEEFQVKSIIAADGINSELAEITGARDKFKPEDVYFGVKVIIKLPEDIIEERFHLNSSEGSAHLFAGDITLNHIGGGFLYTNRETLSLGAVYHYDSLLSSPVTPAQLIDELIKNPLISEYIKDEVPLRKEKNDLSKEDQLKMQLSVSKLIKTYDELRYKYFSKNNVELVESGKFKNIEDIKSKIDSIKQDLIERYGIEFVNNYVELEYSAKLIPDGKRCMMKKPFYKNILFIGDAAGRGIFLGPKIEGLNVGIDDAVRASIAISRSIENNNFDSDYMGNYYESLVNKSPYTTEMIKIDEEYLTLFLNIVRDIPIDSVDPRFGFGLRLMKNKRLRGIALRLANLLGYAKVLPIIESEKTYVHIPILLANSLGSIVNSSYVPVIPTLSERIAKLQYNDDSESHIIVENKRSELMRKLILLCPTNCYSLEGTDVVLQHEGCVECGTCSIGTRWRHPKGEKGIMYRYG
ncbi:MAG TPA: electron transfer flavoprotein [Nitrososphaeraceae archaeon]|nr:electron transfer flavoprotein [Nitrososphaeraceae archaeon]